MAIDLANIPAPKVIEDVDYTSILSRVMMNFKARDPNYLDLIESDPGYMLMEAMAYMINFVLERVNAAAAAVLVTHATGTDLDNLGILFSLLRDAGESDTDFRVRIVDRLEVIVAGSISWYRDYVMEVEVIEVLGTDNVVDGIPTPVRSRVKDAYVRRTQNPSFDSSQSVTPANLPDIPGSLDIFLQSERWTHPVTGVLTQVVPSAKLLQAVKNYIAAEGSNETDTMLQRAAEDRRFTCDTVNILPAAVYPYIYCAVITVASGLDPYAVLLEVQALARAFALENERVGRRVPLSAFYDAIDTESVIEVVLEYPTMDIEPARSAVPVVFEAHDLEVAQYRIFGDVSTFSNRVGDVWSVGQHTNTWWFLVKVAADSQDYRFLSYLRAGNRLSVFAQDAEGNPTGIAIQTYRIAGELQPVGATHYQVELEGTPALTALTDDTAYSLRILDSVEIRLAE